MTLSRSRDRRGTTLAEALVSISVFALILVLVGMVLAKGFTAVTVANARRDAEISLNKAYLSLKKDLESAGTGFVDHKRAPLPGGGDALWFMSAKNPADDNKDTNFIRSADSGAPEWQTHILYYLARPAKYASISGGFNPALDTDTTGDFFAPHKFLVRKVINAPGDPETLLSPSKIDPYITTPADYSLTPFQAETNVLDFKLVADKMLSFEVDVAESTVEIRLSATRLNEAGRSLQIGNVSLKSHPQTLLRKARISLRN